MLLSPFSVLDPVLGAKELKKKKKDILPRNLAQNAIFSFPQNPETVSIQIPNNKYLYTAPSFSPLGLCLSGALLLFSNTDDTAAASGAVTGLEGMKR